MATWSKLFSNFVWKNRPDTSTPLGQTLLNRLNNAINGIDDRVVTLNAEKASTDDLNGSIVNVRLDEKTGIFTFTRFDGTTFTINTALEEVVTNFVYDYETQSLVLTLADGTTQNIDLSALITQYEFTSSATILFTVGDDGKVTANIKPNSITDQMLQTNYLADITTQANTAVSASQSALESQSLAEQSAEDADRHADRAEAAADRAEAITGFTVDMSLDKNSSNPIANKAVAEALENVDAKTLGGHGAEYFVEKYEEVLSTSLLEKAVTLSYGVHNFVLHGSNYNGNDLPDSRYSYGMATVFVRGSSSRVVVLWGSDSPETAPRRIAVNSYNGAWTGWQQHAFVSDLANYLPLGGGEVSGNGIDFFGVKRKDLAMNVFTKYSTQWGVLGYLGFGEANKPSFIDSTGSGVKELLHTGNKPKMTYTGNGDGATRTIAVNAAENIGVLMVREMGSRNFAIVTNSGYIGKSGSTIVAGNDAEESYGNLVLKTTNDLFNTSGKTYYCFAL